MKKEDLLNSIGLVDETLLEHSEYRQQKKIRWGVSAFAACLCLIMAGGYLVLHIGGSTGGSGHQEGKNFDSYAGPVFPLTLEQENANIEAERDITLDFSSWATLMPATQTYVGVTDSYMLTNKTNQTQKVSVLYPFVTTLDTIGIELPAMFVDGNIVKAEWYAGIYSNCFEGSEVDFQDYQSALADENYQSSTILRKDLDYTKMPVVVYEFIGEYMPSFEEKEGYPTVHVMFNKKSSNTVYFNEYADGSDYTLADNQVRLSFGLEKAIEGRKQEPFYLIVLGEDVENLTWKAYASSGWDKELPILGDVEVNVNRYETTLDDILRKFALNYFKGERCDNIKKSGLVDFEMYYSLVCDYLNTLGVLQKMDYRYGSNFSDWISDVTLDKRICYLRAEIEIPAGESRSLNITMNKLVSYNYVCTSQTDIYGFDLATKLGSNLHFNHTTATIAHYENITIVRQNFGFNLKQNLTSVVLDEEERYYLEVTRKLR